MFRSACALAWKPFFSSWFARARFSRSSSSLTTSSRTNPVTQSFLDRLVESLPRARIVLLASYRPDYQHRWGSKSYYAQLRLDPLPDESVTTMLDALVGADARLLSLKQLLIARTEGNPFFIEECIRTLVRDRSAWRAARRLSP